ncbi:OB-fold protein [Pyxidicoccus sp. 3LG]
MFGVGGFAALCFFGTCVSGIGGAARKGGGTASAAPAQPEAEAATKVTQVEIRKLLAEYSDNEIRADSSFKGQYIQTTGVVDDVKKDILNSIYVTLGTGKQLEIPQVQCFFDDVHAKKAAALSKGTKVTVRGRVDGLMMNVLVKECEFVD